jgi:hypothetical protein
MQENRELQTSLSYTVRPCLKKTQYIHNLKEKLKPKEIVKRKRCSGEALVMIPATYYVIYVSALW